jgi:two-component system nitrogen regulation sensor histidine kinase NtrY
MSDSSEPRPVPAHPVKRQLLFLAILLLLAGLLVAATAVYRQYMTANGGSLRAAEESEVTADFQTRFIQFEQGIYRSLDSLHSLPALQRVFTTDDDSVQEGLFFNDVLPQLTSDLAIEVYDADRHLVGWNGPRGPSFPLTKLTNRAALFIADDQIYSYLIASQPVIIGRTLAGYLVGKRLLNVNYPLNNRFINKQSFQTSFETRIADPVDYDFSPRATAATDSETISVRLASADGEKLGYAYLHRNDLATRLQRLGDRERLWCALIGALAWLSILLALFRIPRTDKHPFWQLLAGLATIWLFRYYLIWTDLPPAVFRFSILDPRIYASNFGGGLAKSVADLLLTALALLASVAYLKRFSADDSLVLAIGRLREARFSRVLAIGASFAIAVLLSGLLRAYVAILISAVFDSGIAYDENISLLPGVDVTVMLATLYLITVLFLLFSLRLAKVAARLLRGDPDGRSRTVWMFLTPGIFAIGALVFGNIDDQPLIAGWLRLSLMLCIAGASIWALTREDKSGATRSFRKMIPAMLVSLLILTAFLQRTTENRDRNQIELFAQNISQAPDGWLSVLVQKALGEMTGRDASETLLTGDKDDIEGLAFRQWASSVLGREGNSCSVTYVNNAGEVTSDFHIGIPPHQAAEHRIVIPAVIPSMHTEEKVVNGRVTTWQIGFARIMSERGDTLGGVMVEMSGNRENLLSGDAPEFLRNYPRQSMHLRLRGLVYTEYYQGKLSYSTDDNLSAGRPLPDAVTAETGGQGIWLEDPSGAVQRETYYFPDRSRRSGSAWIGLTVPPPSWGERFSLALRRMTILSLLMLCLMVAILVFRNRRRRSISLTFRNKILIAFCAVSLLPIVILAFVNKQFATDEMESAVAGRLTEQTAVVLAEVQHQLGNMTPATLVQLTDEKCATLASVARTDFHIYLLRSFLASSKPEIFHAGLLDPRISAPAYQAIMVQRKRIFIEHQQIGALPYVAGYRPILAEDGSVIGAVAVPTVYHQIEINEDFTRRDSFLSALYAVALLLSLIAATLFANQIFSPIRRLTDAARQIGGGQLDIGFRRTRSDEIGELEEAFLRMSENLQTMQAEMRQRERETAWREMARQVAHEIKNPLTPMKLSLQHLRQIYADNAKNFAEIFQQVSQTLLEQIDALTRIASEFSRFARMPERIVEECNINSILREALLLYQQDESVRFFERYTSGDLIIRADREELRRAFINLIRNAIQAMNRSGTLTVTTERLGANALIQLTDTGRGISADILHRIFEPNFSTTSDGMGLGLPIVRKIIEELHGTIRLTSAPGRGTTVIIELPLLGPQISA